MSKLSAKMIFSEMLIIKFRKLKRITKKMEICSSPEPEPHSKKRKIKDFKAVRKKVSCVPRSRSRRKHYDEHSILISLPEAEETADTLGKLLLAQRLKNIFVDFLSAIRHYDEHIGLPEAEAADTFDLLAQILKNVFVDFLSANRCAGFAPLYHRTEGDTLQVKQELLNDYYDRQEVPVRREENDCVEIIDLCNEAAYERRYWANNPLFEIRTVPKIERNDEPNPKEKTGNSKRNSTDVLNDSCPDLATPLAKKPTGRKFKELAILQSQAESFCRGNTDAPKRTSLVSQVIELSSLLMDLSSLLSFNPADTMVKRKQKGFQPTKLKVGRQLPKGGNITDTSFKLLINL